MIDNMSTQRYSSLFNLPSTGLYNFIEADIGSLNLHELVDQDTVVVHLAAITDAAGSFGNAEAVERNNLTATQAVTLACSKARARLITLSSTSVYGTQASLVSETATNDELKPQSPYARTKLLEEQFVQEIYQQQSLRSVIFRFGTIFGASVGMRYHTAVNRFCWQAVMRQPVTVWKTAYDQKRPYLSLQDAVGAICHFIRNDIFNGEVYNVLTYNLTVSEIVETIRRFVPSLSTTFVDSPIMNQLSYEVDCRKIAAVGFTPKGSLVRDIGETISMLSAANR
jgi:nucleoside-diphosphate-sugar epimerase